MSGGGGAFQGLGGCIDVSAMARLELEIAGLSRLRVRGMNVDMVLLVDCAAAYILHFDCAGNCHSWLLAVA